MREQDRLLDTDMVQPQQVEVAELVVLPFFEGRPLAQHEPWAGAEAPGLEPVEEADDRVGKVRSTHGRIGRMVKEFLIGWVTA